MKKKIVFAGIIFSCTTVLSSAIADPAIMSGRFTAKSETIQEIQGPGQRCNADDKFYAVIGPLQASASGDYIYQDAGFGWGYDVSLSLHTPSFDPASPRANLVEAWDDHGHADLVTGTDYYFVVQPLCENSPGSWAVTLQGPGDLTGDSAFAPPAAWFGEFTGAEPLAQTHDVDFCEDSYYQASDAIQVDVSGTYYYSDATNWDLNWGAQVTVYEGSFDPANPATNRVDWSVGSAEFELVAGTDYIFVTQPFCEPNVGEYLWVLAPPAPFEISAGLNGAYVNPATPGQGFLLDVLGDFGLVFYAEFTYDTQQPNGMGNAGQIGAPGNRWYTAQGLFQPGDQMIEMPIYVSSGGLFNDPAAVNTVESGSLKLDFSNGCEGGVRTHEFDSGVQGQNSFVRLAPDNLELCIDQYRGAGVIMPPQ